MGESAVIGSPACIANAVSDALGVAVDALPITPTRVLELIRPSRTAIAKRAGPQGRSR
jgi:CO/xanthine dehydrogenase Mo-binding subunit